MEIESKKISQLKNDVKIIKQNTYSFTNYISTIYSPDTCKFETGVFDTNYINDVVILEEYENEDKAIDGHFKWYKLLVENKPKDIINKSTSNNCHHGFGKSFNRKF